MPNRKSVRKSRNKRKSKKSLRYSLGSQDKSKSYVPSLSRLISEDKKSMMKSKIKNDYDLTYDVPLKSRKIKLSEENPFIYYKDNKEEKQEDFVIDYSHFDSRSKRLIDFVINSLEEVPVYIMYDERKDVSSIRLIITTTNIYIVDNKKYFDYANVLSCEYKYIYPIYKFDKELSFDDIKLINTVYGTNINRGDHFNVRSHLYSYITQGYIHVSTTEMYSIMEGYDNFLRKFKGKYDYNGWKKAGDKIFSYDIFYYDDNNRSIKIKPKTESYPKNKGVTDRLNLPVWIETGMPQE